MVFLDGAEAENGAMRLLPGNHLAGPAKRDRGEPTGLPVDESGIDAGGEIAAEAEAGSVLLFPSVLVRRPGPDRPSQDRRALLFRFQPAGRPALRGLRYRPGRLGGHP